MARQTSSYQIETVRGWPVWASVPVTSRTPPWEKERRIVSSAICSVMMSRRVSRRQAMSWLITFFSFQPDSGAIRGQAAPRPAEKPTISFNRFGNGRQGTKRGTANG